jgi:hypothetical protein
MSNRDTPTHYKCNHPKIKERFGDTVSETNLYTVKERLEGKGELNEDEVFIINWINITLDKATNKVAHRKELQAATGIGDRPSKDGGRNAYRETKNKPQDTRSMYAESLDKEIESIKYLMEYMDNNDKNKLL